MKNEIQISIIVCTYNSSRVIGRLLESIALQIYKGFEVVIMDGLSNDNTQAVVEEYSNLINIHWFSERDKGIYDALNKGILKAKGKWIYCIGSDDYLLNRNILMEVNEVLQNDKRADMLYGDVIWGETSSIFNGEYDFPKLLHHNICHQAIFIKREVLIKEGLFDLTYPVYADWNMNLLLFKKGYKVRYIPKTIAYFNLGGLSSQITTDKFREKLELERIRYHAKFLTKLKFYFSVLKKIFKTIPQKIKF